MAREKHQKEPTPEIPQKLQELFGEIMTKLAVYELNLPELQTSFERELRKSMGTMAGKKFLHLCTFDYYLSGESAHLEKHKNDTSAPVPTLTFMMNIKHKANNYPRKVELTLRTQLTYLVGLSREAMEEQLRAPNPESRQVKYTPHWNFNSTKHYAPRD